MVLFKIRSFSVSKFDRCFYTSARETKARVVPTAIPQMYTIIFLPVYVGLCIHRTEVVSCVNEEEALTSRNSYLIFVGV